MLNGFTPANIDGRIRDFTNAVMIGNHGEERCIASSRMKLLPAMANAFQGAFGVDAGPTSEIFAGRLAALAEAAEPAVGPKTEPLKLAVAADTASNYSDPMRGLKGGRTPAPRGLTPT